MSTLEMESLLELGIPPDEWCRRMDFMSNYTFFLPYEIDWDCFASNAWNRQTGVPICHCVAIIYLICVYIGQKVMSNREPFELRRPMIVVNFGLALFSIVGLLRVTPELFRALSRHGFEHSVCVASWTQDKVPFFWMKLFVWSKYFELIDTAFLILRKRPVALLHWYHHASVLVFTWNAMSTLAALGQWFTVMNYAVHSLMYGYFAWRSMGYSCPRWIAMSITTLQVVQMISGCVLVGAAYVITARGDECHITKKVLYAGIAMYSSYLYLFVRFFYVAYIKGANKKPKSHSKEEKSRRSQKG